MTDPGNEDTADSTGDDSIGKAKKPLDEIIAERVKAFGERAHELIAKNKKPKD